jgi:hypothetical protein
MPDAHGMMVLSINTVIVCHKLHKQPAPLQMLTSSSVGRRRRFCLPIDAGGLGHAGFLQSLDCVLQKMPAIYHLQRL